MNKCLTIKQSISKFTSLCTITSINLSSFFWKSFCRHAEIKIRYRSITCCNGNEIVIVLRHRIKMLGSYLENAWKVPFLPQAIHQLPSAVFIIKISNFYSFFVLYFFFFSLFLPSRRTLTGITEQCDIFVRKNLLGTDG